MGQKLTEYYELIRPGPPLGSVSDRAKVLRLEPTVKEILRRLDPALADCDIDASGNWDNWQETLDAVNYGLGILAAREASETKLAPTSQRFLIGPSA
jgi:hypothetical protein